LPIYPIFWLHHCNIDRLWEVWLAQGGSRANPGPGPWQTTPFVFHDETGAQVSLTGADGVDIAGQLGYRSQGAPSTAAAALPSEEVLAVRAARVEPELVGASERP